jgi:hypothetical protein
VLVLVLVRVLVRVRVRVRVLVQVLMLVLAQEPVLVPRVRSSGQARRDDFRRANVQSTPSRLARLLSNWCRPHRRKP